MNSTGRRRKRAGVMKSCWQCGTYEAFTPLVSLFERMACFNIPLSYFECQDERECLRRRHMKMGPSLPWPGPVLGL